MRMMLKVTLPTGPANEAMKSGAFHRVMERTMATLAPEAAYFVADQGCRCALLFFDMDKASDIPAIVEPLFQELGAAIEIQPAMNADDLKAGFQTAP